LELAAIIAAFTGLVTACFAGYIAIRQLPEINRQVNGNMQRAQRDLATAREDLSNIAHDALESNKNEAFLKAQLVAATQKEDPKT
jgi:hypothetical protein